MPARGVSRIAPIGKRFGRVTVISQPRPSQNSGSSSVDCRCDCGDVRPYYISNLARQNEPMCPVCRLKSRPSKGGSGHPLYNIWKGIIQRCENPHHTHFADYGARGIVMCPRWREDFFAFVADVGERPSPSHTLDRKDNDRGYEPGNVGWATQAAQMNNTRKTVTISWRGRTYTLSEAMEVTGLDRATLAWRIKRGWAAERIMTTPSTMSANKGVPKPRRTPS